MTDYHLARSVRAIATHIKNCRAGTPDPSEIEAIADDVARAEEELDARRYVESVSDRVEWTRQSIQSWEVLSVPGATRMRAEATTWKELASKLKRMEFQLVEGTADQSASG